MSVDIFTQILVGATSASLGRYLLRVRSEADDIIIPLVFIISGWAIVIFAMDFNPFAIVSATLFILFLFLRDTMFKEIAFIFAVIGGLAFARGTMGDDTSNMTKLAMVFIATLNMMAFWVFNAPLGTAIVSWVLFALVASDNA